MHSIDAQDLQVLRTNTLRGRAEFGPQLVVHAGAPVHMQLGAQRTEGTRRHVLVAGTDEKAAFPAKVALVELRLTVQSAQAVGQLARSEAQRVDVGMRRRHRTVIASAQHDGYDAVLQCHTQPRSKHGS